MKRITGLFAAVFTVIAILITANGAVPVQAASAKTATGLADHVVVAYKNDWKYASGGYGQFFGSRRGTDCSGLIKSYMWWQGEGLNPKPGSVSVAGSSSAMLASAKVSGTIKSNDSSSLPRIHGLILYEPGHVGVYVGNNLAIDSRSFGEDIKCENVFGRRSIKWTKWFKLPQITYPTTGWETFNGEEYYYEDGQYVVDTTRTLDGVTYTFGSDGTVVSEVPAA